MRKLLVWAAATFFLVIICGPAIANALAEAPAGESVVEPPVQKSRVLPKEDRRAALNPLVVKVDDFHQDWWAVVISSLALLVAFFQLLMFQRQLKQMDEANRAARDAAEAARAALNASNPPHIRISNPQIWCGKKEPFERETDAVKLDDAGRFSARVYAINEGGCPAHVDIDVGIDGNVCVAWFSDLGDGQLPMFRPYKEESKVKIDKFRLKRNIEATAHPESQEWVDRNPSEDGYLTLQPGEVARWELDFSLEKLSGDGHKRTLYLMGIVVYWSLSGKQRSRRRAVGFAYKFDQEKQVFRRLSSEDYPDYVFDE